MKPYIAILIDSFWEAVGNKVLWALLIGWSFILLGLAPFGYVVESNFRLSSFDISDRGRLVEKLARGAKGQGPQDIRAVAQRLEPNFLIRLQAEAASDSTGRRVSESELATGLNAVVAAPDLYDKESFPTADRRQRLQPLIEQVPEGLLAAEREQLHRELLQLAFPLELNRPRGEQLWIGYAGFKLGEPLAITRRQINQFVEPLLLTFIIKLGLGVVAVFVALIVTSSIIPETFRSSSLHLLLSKPISRVWLFLWKFFGGCIFVLFNITFVLIGLYLIAGLRFDIWNNGLLGCIPLLMFVFVIFYSVSALAGLLWGNAIVSVVCCMIFWLFCFSAGFMREIMRPQVEVHQQLSRIREVQGNLLSVDEQGGLGVWNAEYAVWQPAIEPETHGQSRTFGPLYDPERELLLVKSFFRLPFGNLQAGSRKLSIVRMGESTPLATPAPSASEEGIPAAPLRSAKPSDIVEARTLPKWIPDPGPELPQQLFDLLQLNDSMIAVTRGGLFKLNLEKLEQIGSSERAVFGIKLPWLTGNAFENVTPPGYYLKDNTSASATADGESLVVYSSGSLDVLRMYDGRFQVQHSLLLDEAGLGGDGTEASLVQMNSSFCVLARDGLPLSVLSGSLEKLAELDLPGGSKVRHLAWVPGTDTLALVTHTGQLLRLDCNALALTPLATPFSGQCTSLNWLDEQRVWLGVKPNRAYLFNTASGVVEQACIPRATTFEKIYNWVVNPLYLVNPKPSALDNAMSYLLSGDQTMTTQLVTNDLKAAQIELQIWQPILSNLAFVAIVLGISCVYVARKEF